MNHQLTSRKHEFQKKITIIKIEEQTESKSDEFQIFRRKIQNARQKAKSHSSQLASVVYDGDVDNDPLSSVEGIYLVQKEANRRIHEEEPNIKERVVNQLIGEFSEEKDDNTFYEAVRKNKNNQLESRKIYNVVFHVRELIAYLCKTYALAEQIQSYDSDLLIFLKCLYETFVFLRDGLTIKLKSNHTRILFYLIANLGSDVSEAELLEGAEELITEDAIVPLDVCDATSLKSGLDELVKWQVVKSNADNTISIVERVEI